MVKILQTSEQAESKIKIRLEKLNIEPDKNDTDLWTVKGKAGGFKANNKPSKIQPKKDELVECAPCETQFHEREIETHIEENNLEVKSRCQVCNEALAEGEMEEHITKHDSVMQKCEKCTKTYTSSDKIKRHIWRAHTPIECSLCGSDIESRHELKHHKENVHKVTKILECKHAKDGNCIDGEEECLFTHDVQDYKPNPEKKR